MVSCRVIPAVIEWIFLVLEDIQFAVGVFPAPNNEGDQGFPLPLSMKIMFSFAKSSFVTYSEHVGACISSCLALSVYYFNGAYVGHKVKLGQYPEGALYTLSSFNCNFSTDNVLRSVTGEVVSCISGAHIAIQCVSILFLASYLMMTCNVVLK
ncbi:MAG: hypothetical protein BJ554DRAFT_8398 [Olpidium bornovanus]|uniref:Uncharacterized protein n=1 Tax=Olpidium bornovanus TaxID=278681 RepID=A0A8H8DIH9_9FUNG|nr:MAG: hypothetical protein BJ554DRAFT_8398 [Olpidium bornovanus]